MVDGINANVPPFCKVTATGVTLRVRLHISVYFLFDRSAVQPSLYTDFAEGLSLDVSLFKCPAHPWFSNCVNIRVDSLVLPHKSRKFAFPYRPDGNINVVLKRKEEIWIGVWRFQMTDNTLYVCRYERQGVQLLDGHGASRPLWAFPK